MLIKFAVLISIELTAKYGEKKLVDLTIWLCFSTAQQHFLRFLCSFQGLKLYDIVINLVGIESNQMFGLHPGLEYLDILF